MIDSALLPCQNMEGSDATARAVTIFFPLGPTHLAWTALAYTPSTNSFLGVRSCCATGTIGCPNGKIPWVTITLSSSLHNARIVRTPDKPTNGTLYTNLLKRTHFKSRQD
jgi:hypothetical protein